MGKTISKTRKGFLTFAFSLLFVFASIFALSPCGNPVKAIDVDSSGAKTAFGYGETFSASGLKAKLTYNDNADKNVAFAGFQSNKITIDSSAYISTTAGTYVINIIYDKSATIRDSYTVTVAEPTENGFSVDKDEAKLYVVGDNLEVTGLEVYKTFEEDAASSLEEAVTEEYDVEVAEKEGVENTYTVTISYKDYDDQTFDTEKEELILDRIEVDATGLETDYAYGEELDTTDLKVFKLFEGTSLKEQISTGWTVSAYYPTEPGTQEVIVALDDDETKTATFTITVNAPTPKGIELDTTSVDKEYIYGANLDLTGLKIFKTFEEDTDLKTELTETEYLNVENDGYESTTEGEQTITITYDGKRATFYVTVAGPTFNGIELDATSVTKTYAYGAELDLTGLVVFKTFEEELADNVELTTEEYTVTGYVAKTVGTQTITITYDGKIATFDVTVAGPTFNGIMLDTESVTKKYAYGANLDLTGLKIFKTFEEDTGLKTELTETEYLNVENDGYKSTTEGEQTITITYDGKIATFTVTVNAPTFNGIMLDTESVTKKYAYGANLDLTGLKIFKTFEEELADNVELTTEEYTVTGYNATTVGTQTITITYNANNEITATFVVTVAGPTFNGIMLDDTSVTKTYAYGAELNLTNLKVYKTFEEEAAGNVELTTGEYTVTGYVATTEGEQTITITYDGKTATFKVTVNAPIENGWGINTDGVKKVYAIGDELNLTGLVVFKTFEGTEITENLEKGEGGYSVDDGEFNSEAAGTYTITITYDGKTATFKVVNAPTENGWGINTDEVKDVYALGDALDLAGLVVFKTFEGTEITENLEKGEGGYSVHDGGFNSEVADTYTITITYGTGEGSTKTFAVTVLEPIH